MWVYYKQHNRWKGPIKVHSINGKKICSVRAGKLITVDKDDVVLSKAENGAVSEHPLKMAPGPAGIRASDVSIGGNNLQENEKTLDIET